MSNSLFQRTVKAVLPDAPDAPPNSRWQKCPVCEGRGTVPAGFYSVLQATRERCRSCDGKGIVR